MSFLRTFLWGLGLAGSAKSVGTFWVGTPSELQGGDTPHPLPNPFLASSFPRAWVGMKEVGEKKEEKQKRDAVLIT